MAACFFELSGNRTPTRHDRRSSSLQSLPTVSIAAQEIGRAFGDVAHLLHLSSRHASLSGPVDSILLWRSGLSAHRAFGGIRCNAKLLQMHRKLLAPMAQGCFPNVQPHPLLALCFDDQ